MAAQMIEKFEIENGEKLTAFQLSLYAFFGSVAIRQRLEERFEELDFEGISDGQLFRMGEFLKNDRNDTGHINDIKIFVRYHNINTSLLDGCMEKMCKTEYGEEQFGELLSKGRICYDSIRDQLKKLSRDPTSGIAKFNR